MSSTTPTQLSNTPSLKNVFRLQRPFKDVGKRTVRSVDEVAKLNTRRDSVSTQTTSLSDSKEEVTEEATSMKVRKINYFKNLLCSHRLFKAAGIRAVGSVDEVITITKRGNLVAYFESLEVETGELIGTGSFAEVYEVTALNLLHDISFSFDSKNAVRRYYSSNVFSEDGESARYVVKSIKSSRRQNERAYNRAVEALEMESKLLLQVDHPNIISVRGMPFAKASTPFIMMDRLSETLDSRIMNWRKSATSQGPSKNLILTKVQYAFDLANALNHLHKEGIIYRDLKPGNVGFSEGNVIQLFDFGLARKVPAIAKLNEDLFLMTAAGTQRYMAPEIFRSHIYNLKADVYSWSILLYEMLSELKAYQGYSAEQHLHSVCKQGMRPIVSPTSVPSALEALLEQAWDHDVSNRLTMDEVCKNLLGLMKNSICLQLEVDTVEFDDPSTKLKLISSAA